MEQWRRIEEFPDYSVSDQGRVRNEQTGRLMAMTRNQTGTINVGLTKDLIQYKRSVTVLVADAFVPRPLSPHFDTPIHLDGDKSNNVADNLVWRPRWFAIKYHQQFSEGAPRGFLTPVMDLDTKEVFETSFEAAITFGLLDRDIFLSIINNTVVTPTYQRFALVDDEPDE